MSTLIRATTQSCAPLAGHSFVPIDFNRLVEFKTEAYDDRVSYVFGSKDPHPGSGVIDFTGIDCSGWFRTLLDYICHNLYDPGDGSYNQGHKLIDDGFYCHSIGTPEQYLAAATYNDGLFRTGFHWPNGRGGDSTGHVFPIVHNHTIESYGGNGPGERPANHPWFVTHCDLVVVIGPILSSASWNSPSFNPYINHTNQQG